MPKYHLRNLLVRTNIIFVWTRTHTRDTIAYDYYYFFILFIYFFNFFYGKKKKKNTNEKKKKKEKHRGKTVLVPYSSERVTGIQAIQNNIDRFLNYDTWYVRTSTIV